MYLKNIEIQGFKSFAKKNRFDFHSGITGIVGPNGSGKSNVADAVRWVLGEQRTRQLRGGHMQDVIFSGTETKKPLAFASVTITFNNSDHQIPVDYEEVTVTRKLFRSGESEYLINGASCRLKDIYELFYDTGIGKEGYSIIGQGQIDKILSGKPEERRELFDEAAGIVKFKRRKAESLKKLANEEQNLARVKDILQELEKQLTPLEKQADKAKKYLAMKEELKQYDINVFLTDYSKIKSKSDEVNINIENTLLELKTAKGDFDRKKTEYEAVGQEEEEIDSRMENYSLQLSESQILKEQLEGKVALLYEQINSIKNTDVHYQKRYESIRQALGEKEIQLRHISESRKSLTDDYRQKIQSEKESAGNLASIQTDIMSVTAKAQEVKEKMLQVISNRAETKTTIERYSVMGEQAGFRIDEVCRTLHSAEETLDSLVSEIDSKKITLAEADVNIQALKEQKDETEKKIAGYVNDRDDLKKQFQLIQNAYIREEARRDSLRELSSQYEGFGISVKKVMALGRGNQDIHGVVADVIRVHKDYETAIETALGGNIQNIIVEDDHTAKTAINFLKTNGYGRATFLPIQSIKKRKCVLNREVFSEPGVIAAADELADTDEKYRQVIGSLLGNTLVVDDIHSGIRLSKKYKQSMKIVTKEGELFHVGGAITGGRHKNTQHMLGRYRELSLAEEKLPKMKREMEDLQLKISQYDEQISRAEKKKEGYRLNLSKEYEGRNEINLDCERLELKIKEEKEKIRKWKKELDSLHLTLKNAHDNEEASVEELCVSKNIEKDLKCELDVLNLKLGSLLGDEVKYKEISDGYILELSKIEQHLLFEKENADRVEGEIEALNREMAGLVHTQENVSRKITEKEAEIRDLKTAIHNSKDLFREIHEEIAACKQRKEDLNKRHKAVILDRERMSGRISDLEKEMIRLENAKNHWDESQRKLLDYMWDEYELTYHQALQKKKDTVDDLPQIKRNIAQLKERIKDLGNVNVNAIEDYKELWERYSFLKTQHDDIYKAQASLSRVILELDTAMRKRFSTQLKEISSEYNSVFQALFGGGKGTIEICRDEDILEADLQIVAQPPGKKLQNMMQLSGGEKALTAISLLFAIQNLKPSPFCLLDEIEAALDDHNIVRFSQYLQKLSRRTQFIVITHRRGTMNAADRLYGITMMEKGISTQVSVSLLDHLEEKNGR